MYQTSLRFSVIYPDLPYLKMLYHGKPIRLPMIESTVVYKKENSVKKRILQIAAAVLAVCALVLSIVIFTNGNSLDASTQGTVFIYGEAIGKSLDSFVVKTPVRSGHQTFYVFHIEDDTAMLDADGNLIRFGDILMNSDVAVEISPADYADYYEERHELVPTEIHIEE